MGRRCTFGEHGSCNACHQFVQPTQRDHVHIFRAAENTYEILCQECWLSTAVAAGPVLNAIRAAGFPIGSWRHIYQIVRDNVIIGVQAVLEIPPPSPN